MLSCKYDFVGSFRSPASLKMIISQFDLIRDWMIDVKPNNVIYLGNRLSGTYFPMKSFAYELRRELPVKFTFHSRSCGWENFELTCRRITARIQWDRQQGGRWLAWGRAVVLGMAELAGNERELTGEVSWLCNHFTAPFESLNRKANTNCNLNVNIYFNVE